MIENQSAKDALQQTIAIVDALYARTETLEEVEACETALSVALYKREEIKNFLEALERYLFLVKETDPHSSLMSSLEDELSYRAALALSSKVAPPKGWDPLGRV